MLKAILVSTLDSKRGTGTPKTGWITEMQNELRKIEFGNWIQKAENRMEWAAAVLEANDKKASRV